MLLYLSHVVSHKFIADLKKKKPNYISNCFALSLFLSLGSQRLIRKGSGLTY